MPESDVDIVDLKIVVRCRDFQASFRFYRDILGLDIVEQWNEPGGEGCVFSATNPSSVAAIEIYAMTEQDPRYEATFAEPLRSDKVDVQLRTSDLDRWVDRLRGKWPFSEPEETAWGHRWIKLRDPDGLLIAIYEVLPD